MAEFTFKLNVVAASQEEATKVANAMNAIYKIASNDDLIKLAEALKKKPGLVKTAMKWI